MRAVRVAVCRLYRRRSSIGPSRVDGCRWITPAGAVACVDQRPLDHGFAYANVPSEKPEFTKRPSEYVREQVWACTFFEEIAVHKLLDELGADRVLFETDYPHPICLYGNGVRQKIDAAAIKRP